MKNTKISVWDIVEGTVPKSIAWTTGLGKPFIYDEDPDDPQYLLLNQHNLKCLRKTMEYVEKGASYKDAAIWLQAATGKSCTRQMIFYMHKKLLAERKAKREAKRFTTLNKNKIDKVLKRAKRTTSTATA